MSQAPLPPRASPGKMMIGSPTKRREMDLMKLMMSNYEVTTAGDSSCEFWVKFHGPKNTPYEGGVWQVHVELPETYPYKPPTLRFINQIFHPNIDFNSGWICLDVITQTWSPMYDLINVFDIFLPQLLTYPNSAHGFNNEAVVLLAQNPEEFVRRVREHVRTYGRAGDKSPTSSTSSSSPVSVASSEASALAKPASETEDLSVEASSQDSDIEELEL